MEMQVQTQPQGHKLVVRQMKRFKVEPRIAKEEVVRDKLRSATAEPCEARTDGMPAALRTACTMTLLACGLMLNLSTVAQGSQLTVELLRRIATL